MRLQDTENKLNIIMITEVKTKSARYKLTEAELRLGGGSIIYTPT